VRHRPDRLASLIKLRDFRVLMAIADSGSMAKAAAKLGISHPAVSKTISDLEGALGLRLLDRGSQGTELTAHGEVLLRCGIKIFDEMQQGLRSFEYPSDPTVGEVRLGCTDILNSLVPPIVRRFSKEHPGVQLDVNFAIPGEHQMQQLRVRIDALSTAIL
jgi:molybdate transport repressor ModE-like protein